MHRAFTRRDGTTLMVLLGALGCANPVGPERGVTAPYLTGTWFGERFEFYGEGLAPDRLSWMQLRVDAGGGYRLLSALYDPAAERDDSLAFDGSLTVVGDSLVLLTTAPDPAGFWEAMGLTVADPLRLESFRVADSVSQMLLDGSCRLERRDVLRLATRVGQAAYDVNDDGVREPVAIAWQLNRTTGTGPCPGGGG